MTAQPVNLTQAERRRVERIDHLVALGAEGVDELLAGMSDPSWTVRRAIVSGLAALGDDAVGPLCGWLRDQRSAEQAIAAAVDALSGSVGGSATPGVLPLLADHRPAVAADAARILGRRRAAAAAPLLGEALEHADDNVAVAAIEALGEIGGAIAVDALLGVVRRGSFFRTFTAIQVLSRTGDPRVVDPLALLLADPMYRTEAVRALGRSGFAQAIRPLAGLLAEDDDATARTIALALADLLARAEWNGSIDHVVDTLRVAIRPTLPRFIDLLAAAEPAERGAIATILGWIGDASAVPDLARLLVDPGVRAIATDAIQRISRVDDDAVIRTLAGGDSPTRAAVLPVVTTTRAAAVVRGLLADEDPEIRARACEALARIGDVAAVPALFVALADPNPRVAYAATAAIHSLGAADTPGLVIVALQTGTHAVRRHALRICAYMGFPDTFDAVSAAIADPDPRIAELAVAALGSLAEPRVGPMLVDLALDEREPIRAATMRAVGHRGGTGASLLLAAGVRDPAAWVRYYACQGLGRIADQGATDLVLDRLADEMPHVRIAAIEALANLEEPAAWLALCAVVRSPSVDEQRAALTSMALRPRDEALPFLLDGASSADVATRLIALSGLARRSDVAAVNALASAALHDEPAVSAAALSLLGDRGDPGAAAALVEIAVATADDHPAHLTLSLPGTARIAAIATRLVTADDRTAGVLASALARMRHTAATAELFVVLALDNPSARRAAASALAAVDGDRACSAIARLALEDPDPEMRRICAAASAR